MGFLRWALNGVFVWMIARNIIQPDQTEQIVVGLAGALAMLAWIVWTKIRERRKLVTAMALPSGATEASVEQTVKAGLAPSVSTPRDVSATLSTPTVE
jgi:hypothetical protein